MHSVENAPRGLFAGKKGRARKEALTAYLFLLPASLVIFAEALEKTDCLGISNYVDLLGFQNAGAVAGMIIGLILAVSAYVLWQRASKRETGEGRGLQIGAGVAGLVAVVLLIRALPGRLILRLVSVVAILAAALFFFFVDFQRMWELGSQSFFKSLLYTVFYSIGTVPIQLGVSLALAYILFQGIRGRGAFRLLYFMPYIAPSVATAVVFRRIFSLRDTGLMNRLVGTVGIPPLKWLSEAKGINLIILDLWNQAFGTQLTWPDFSDPLNVILVGPSLALVSIIIYNWWVFVGYDTVIYLAGLGSIPHELYEAAEIDGAGRWAMFRKITFPLLSPTTFFLTVIATIGTFKAFNHIWMMKELAARETVDTASILIFQTFRADGRFGEATAMAFILFGIILVLSQIQNRIGEKLVFYG